MSTRSPWPRWQIIFLSFLLALSVALEWRPLLAHLRPTNERVVDFFQEWSGGRLWRDGISVYASQELAIAKYLGWQVVLRDPREPFNEVNAHPPAAVLLVVPLSFLSYPDACLIWNLLSLGILGGMIYLLSTECELNWSAWSLLPLLTLLLFCRPLREQIFFGQLNVVLLALLVLGWRASRQCRDLPAGLLFATATALKLFPGFVLVYFLLRRRYRVLVGATLGLALWSALTIGFFGWEDHRRYLVEVLPRLSKYRDSWLNLSIVGYWYRLFLPVSDAAVPLINSPTIARFGILLSWLAVVGVLLRVVPRVRSAQAEQHAFGMCLVGMLLVSPITWPHYLLLLAFPLLLMLRDIRNDDPAKILLLLCLGIFWINPIFFFRLLFPLTAETRWTTVAEPWHCLTLLSLQGYALVAVFVLGLRETMRADAQRSGGGEQGTTAAAAPESSSV